jgi:hypothetical protein
VVAFSPGGDGIGGVLELLISAKEAQPRIQQHCIAGRISGLN